MAGNSSNAKASRSSRSARKAAAREEDRRLLSEGIPPQDLQRRNSAFPHGVFAGAPIENLAAAIGR